MIKKILSNAVLSLVMDKQAKQKLKSIRGQKMAAKGMINDEIPKSPRQAVKRRSGPDRQQLIAQAMAIHQSKSAILDDLTLNEKRQLKELAAKALLGSFHDNERE